MPEDCPEFVRTWRYSNNAKERSKSLAQIYDKYSRYLFHFVYRMTRNVQSSKDIVQDVFVKLMEKRTMLRIENFKALITTMAHNLVYDKYYRSREAKNASLDEMLELFGGLGIPVSLPSGNAELVRAAYSQELLRRIFRKASRSERELLLLLREGYTYAEAAEILGTSEDAVKKRAQSLKTKMKELKK